jgi:hypothetical protein
MVTGHTRPVAAFGVEPRKTAQQTLPTPKFKFEFQLGFHSCGRSRRFPQRHHAPARGRHAQPLPNTMRSPRKLCAALPETSRAARPAIGARAAPHASRPSAPNNSAAFAPERAPNNSAARPGARTAPHASRPSARQTAQPPAPVRAQRRTPRARARAKQLSRMLGTKTSEKSWKTRSRSAIETTHTRTGEPGRLLFQPSGGIAKTNCAAHRPRISRRSDHPSSPTNSKSATKAK